MKTMRLAAAAMALAMGAVMAQAEEKIEYEGALTATAGSGDFAPLYMSSLSHGVIESNDNVLLGASLRRELDLSKRFSWSYGLKGYAGWNASAAYARYDLDTKQWGSHDLHNIPYAWIQELYGTVKYRGVYLTVGAKEEQTPLLNQRLTSGDMVMSGNARPIPGVRAGFVDFQNIPFTRGWAQISGEVFYGRGTDGDWWKSHFNYFDGHICTQQYWVYRRCYFRSKPEMPFSVTVGMQCASQFGGTTVYYKRGKYDHETVNSAKPKDFIKMFLPIEDGTEGFVQGSSLGSWDLQARYRLRDNSEVKFYFEWPWEDGSGIGKLNGFDGLWGVEYDFSDKSSLVRAVVVEYLDLTNQSGPFHWDPDDRPNTTLTYRAEGGDNYYNNAFYNPYAYYGVSLGTPLSMAPVYNLDGNPIFIGNRMRAIHLGVEGNVADIVDLRLKLGHRRSWGNAQRAFDEPRKSTSFMLEGTYKARKVPGLTVKAAFAFDSGNLPQSNAAGLLTVSYRGAFTLGNRE